MEGSMAVNWRTGVNEVSASVAGIFLIVVLLLSALPATAVQEKPDNYDPYSLLEGSLERLNEGVGRPPEAGAVILSNTPADYDWWNGCSPTAAGMLFGWWDEAGVDAFPGNHRNLPATYYPGTSSDPSDYQDARGVIAGWAHKQAGVAKGYTYGDYAGHAPDSIADFIRTSDGGTSRFNMPWGFENFGAWDDPRTSEIESHVFEATNYYTDSGWDYADYCAEIDAGRPVHLGLDSTAGAHSVLGVGYNNTGGKENVVLLTTWHIGLQEWEWSEETCSGYEFSVYGGTQMTAGEETPALSAYVSLAHTYVGDLTVTVGIGEESDPTWSTTAWSQGGGSADNLVLTDLDCTDVLSEFLTGDLDWFLSVTDSFGGDVGTIEDFQIRYQFDEDVFYYDGSAVPIYDNQTVYAYLTTPEPVTLGLLAFGGLALLRRKPSTR